MAISMRAARVNAELTQVEAAKIIGVAPAQQIHGLVHQEIFIVHAPLRRPGQEKIWHVINANLRIFMAGQRPEPIAAGHLQQPADAIDDDLDFYAAICRVQKRR